MTTDLGPGVAVARATVALVGGAVPCAARPSTGFVHLDGPCRCFVGGPAPEFPPAEGAPGPLVTHAA